MKKIFTILSLVCVATFANAQTSLLTNPGFESDFTGWSSGPTSSYTAPTIETGGAAHGGTKYAGYTAATATTGFYQNIAVTEGKDYTIAFWYKSSGDDSDSRLWSVYKNAAGSPVYTTGSAADDSFRTNNGYLPTATEWTFHQATMPAGVGATNLDVAVRAYSGGTASFDDFIVVEGTLAVVDVKEFDRQVKMNTLVGDQLTLRLPERSTVNIYSIDGKLISSNRVSDGGSVSTASLVKGNYIVTVDNGSVKISRKIIKK